MKKIFFLITFTQFLFFSSCKNDYASFGGINQTVYLPGLYEGEKNSKYDEWNNFCKLEVDSFYFKKLNALKKFREKDPATYKKFWEDSPPNNNQTFLYESKAFKEYSFFIQNQKMLSYKRQKEAKKIIMGEE